MAKAIARISGTALVPGVSKNGRLYTAEAIGKAVNRARNRLASGGMPLTMLTHHEAGDDSTRIVGMLTKVWQADDGRARYDGVLFDTEHGRNIATLADDSDGEPAALRTVSIRGYWVGPTRIENHEGQRAQTADDLEIDGLDFTKKPGVDGADVADFQWTAAGPPTESGDGRTPIYESAPEAHVTHVEEAATVESSTVVTDKSRCDGTCCESCGNKANESVEEKGAPALKSGKAAAPQTKAKRYADPGYQDDKAPRYALDTKDQAKAAWSYINMPKNAKLYTANQLKRIKQRIIKALRGFGVKVDAKERWVIDSGVLAENAESGELREYMGDNGGFRVELNNGPLCVSIYSYCIDPADLDVIGRAAMAAACDSLKSLDPDMDGDIDVDGAPAEDTDHDNESVAEPTTTETAASKADTTAAPEAVADPTESQEAPVVTDEAPKAAEQAADAKTDSDLGAKFDALTAAITGLVSKMTPAAPAAVAAETAPEEKTETAEPAVDGKAKVAETEDERITRLVKEGIAAALPQAVQAHVEQNGAQRKGLSTATAGTVTETSGTVEYPETWPRDEAGTPIPAHKMTREQFQDAAAPVLLDYVTNGRAR